MQRLFDDKGIQVLQLVYASTARSAEMPIDLDALFEQARQNNRRDEITGVLFTDGMSFLQGLEGGKEMVEDVFLRIIADPRHCGLALLSRRIVLGREFGEWDMARFAGFDQGEAYLGRIAELMKDTPLWMQQAVRDLIDRKPPQRIAPS